VYRTLLLGYGVSWPAWLTHLLQGHSILVIL